MITLNWFTLYISIFLSQIYCIFWYFQRLVSLFSHRVFTQMTEV